MSYPKEETDALYFFTDASIDTRRHIACSGCIVTNFKDFHDERYLIQYNATNNSAEILAIQLGVQIAIEMKDKIKIPTYFFLFSDSRISVDGVRSWLPGWIDSQDPNGVLFNSSGEPVKNQEYFINIYNMILQNGLHIKFYCQRGHIDESPASSALAEEYFLSANKINLYKLMIPVRVLSQMNNMVDNNTRTILTQIIEKQPCEYSNVNRYYESPLIYRADRIRKRAYQELIQSSYNPVGGKKQ